MQDQKNNFLIPGAIILAGFIIAGGVYLSNKSDSATPKKDIPKTEKMKPVSATEHILGNPDSPIIIVEFSDTECPFCKRYHDTMHTIMNTYGKDGKVAWVYRHFPLDSLHQKTRKEAEATECANDLGGNTAFWKMLDAIYKNTTSNDGLDLAQLPVYAKSAGLDITKFNDCLSSGKFASAVEAQFQDGIKAGAQGTPYNVMILKTALTNSKETAINSFVAQNGLSENVFIQSDKKSIILNGALPLELVKPIIDAIIK